MISRKQLDVLKHYSDMFGLPHRYTQTPKLPGGTDSYNNRKVTLGTAVEDKPCRYRDSDALRREEQGKTTIYRPQLSLPSEDTIGVGDLVSDVVDSELVVLMAGPMEVESIIMDASLGPAQFKVAYLKSATVRH